MIKYLGSKRLLVPDIVSSIGSVREGGTVLDLFSGTSRVGHALKRAGYRVLANDHNAYAHTLAACYVRADAEDVLPEARSLVAELNACARRAEPGAGHDFFTRTYCVESRFFHPRNGPRIAAVREEIARRGLPTELEAVALVSLMEAADRVDSTTGVQMAYLKDWAPRAFNDLELRVPDVLPRASAGKGVAVCMDAEAAARALSGEADVVYLDPPYNQHSYLGNYHIWETLVRWDAPEVYGTACKRVDCRERKSAFNSKRAMREAFEEVLEACGDRALVVSFSDEGYLGRAELEGMLSRRGRVRVMERDYKRYVGAQIGIYNPSGERVGKVSHLRNTEMLFVVVPRRSGAGRLRSRSTSARAGGLAPGAIAAA
ncbi:MAG: DNA adenine methylase [Phycisphaeraceae bacterium]|nr:DNA adenine methylase [Phycisphaeraceae bacterium]